MMRFLVQWLISRRLDDGKPLGTLLSRWIRNDEPTRRFYEDSLRLGTRLRSDAVRLLASDHQNRPLAIVSRTILQPRRRRRYRTTMTAALFFLVLLGSGVFLSLPGTSIVAQSPGTNRLDVETIQNDPSVLAELLELCRTQ